MKSSEIISNLYALPFPCDSVLAVCVIRELQRMIQSRSLLRSASRLEDHVNAPTEPHVLDSIVRAGTLSCHDQTHEIAFCHSKCRIVVGDADRSPSYRPGHWGSEGDVRWYLIVYIEIDSDSTHDEADLQTLSEVRAAVLSVGSLGAVWSPIAHPSVFRTRKEGIALELWVFDYRVMLPGDQRTALPNKRCELCWSKPPRETLYKNGVETFLVD